MARMAAVSRNTSCPTLLEVSTGSWAVTSISPTGSSVRVSHNNGTVLGVGCHLRNEVHAQRILGLAPDERDQGQVQEGRDQDFHVQAACFWDPLGNPQRRVQRLFGVDVDHHFEPRLDHAGRNLGVGGHRETALIHVRGEGRRLARDLFHVRLPAVHIEPNTDGRNTRRRGLPGRREHPQQRPLARDQRDRMLPATALPGSDTPWADRPRYRGQPSGPGCDSANPGRRDPLAHTGLFHLRTTLRARG